ncbi:hypothetical protein GN956_G23740 [Arapaima gigas]
MADEKKVALTSRGHLLNICHYLFWTRPTRIYSQELEEECCMDEACSWGAVDLDVHWCSWDSGQIVTSHGEELFFLLLTSICSMKLSGCLIGAKVLFSFCWPPAVKF